MRNIDYIIKSISLEKDLPEDEVKKLITFYWKDLKEQMFKLENESLFIRNIGTFQVSYTLIYKEVYRIIKRIRTQRENGNEKMVKYLENYLNDILRIREKTSKTYYDKPFRKRLRESWQNSRGNKEQG